MASTATTTTASAMDRVLEQKLKKVVEVRTDTPAMLEALQAIAAFYGQEQGGNTAEARKNLRQDLEKQNMALCDRFLGLFAVLRARLDGLEAHTASLEGHCQSIHARIDAAEESMSAFLGKARGLQQQQAEVEARAGQIQAFLEKFILSDAEVASLRHDPIDKVVPGTGERPFFAALQRVQEIRLGCSQLVGSKHQAAGLEMLEALSEHQEAAFRRLHSWILQRCAGLEQQHDAASFDEEENDAALGLGLRTMRERPALFLHCQECLLQRRRDVVRRRFLLALTQGGDGALGVSGSGGSGALGASHRPIDMQAHDPVRYLGDILAWLHQAVASEREFLLNLFGPSAPPTRTPGGGEEGEAEAEVEGPKELSLEAILQGIMDGVAPLLKARILQLLDPATLQASGGGPGGAGATPGSGSSTGGGNSGGHALLVLHFRLLNLLAFYEATLRTKLRLGGSQLALAVGDARAQCQRLFEAGLRHVGEAALESPPAITMDMGAAPVTQEAGRRLGEILAVHAAALLPPPDDADGGAGEGSAASGPSYVLDDVLAALVEPVLRACRLGAEGLLDPSDSAVYMLNQAAALRASLEEHTTTTSSGSGSAPAARAWLGKLQGEMEAWLAALVRYQSEAVLERSGLGTLLERAAAVAEAGAGGPLSAQPGLDAATVAQTMKGFYSGLFALPQFERLQAPSLRAEARQRTAVRIAEAHEKAHALLDKPENEYADRVSFLFHTPEQVRILLDCD